MDVISGYVRLAKAGVNYKALCPFHNEKTPSFMVSPSRQNWHCFGCGEGGDILTFIQKIEGIEFFDALKMLAEKAGITLEHGDPKSRSEKDKIYEICEKSAQFFSLTLRNPNLQIHSNTANNNPIVDYLHKRGLNEKTIDEWRLGYAPDSWDSLLSFLKTNGYKEKEIEKAGLVVQAPRYHDRFRNRLMFPIFDGAGKVVAFSGRVMSDIIPSKTEKPDSGKYINSPETILFSKSRILYGLNNAKTDIRKADKAVLVEGQMDVLLPWQDGVKNIIATSGTSLTEEQLIIIKRLTNNLVLAFDTDDAGFRATKRGIDLAQASGFNISIVPISGGKDPADFVKENPGKFAEVINQPEPIMSYYFNRIFTRFNPEKIESKKVIAVTLLSEIKRLPSAIERSSWIRELGLRLGISERDLEDEMSRLESQIDTDNARPNTENFQRDSASNQRESAARKSRREILSERLLALLLKEPKFMGEALGVAAFLPPSDFEIISALSANSENFSNIRTALHQDLRPRLDFLYLAADYEIEKFGSNFDIGGEMSSLIMEIKKEHYRETLSKIGQEIKKQESVLPVGGGNGGENLETLTKKFQDIAKILLDLSKDKNGKKI